MINNLRHHPLYNEIDEAVPRYSELPFTLDTPIGVIDGVIDLIYRDKDGYWHLIDWKTEFLRVEQVQEESHKYLAQLALYTLAIQKTFNTTPAVTLCYLNPRLQLFCLENEELAQESKLLLR